jgi:hypothetical protein
MIDQQKLRRIAEELGKKGRLKTGRRYWKEFPVPHLMGWLLHKGHCPYCGENLLDSKSMQNAIGGTDHLLPRCDYPELENDPLNFVPVCAGCNGLKRHWDPNTCGPILYNRGQEDHIRDEEVQSALIERAKAQIEKRRTERVANFPEDHANWLRALEELRGR